MSRGTMSDLPAIMATLEIKDSPSKPNCLSSLRKRTAKLVISDTVTPVKNKRRCNMLPSKKSLDAKNLESLKNYYLNNKVKSKSINSNLETIYEDPVVTKDGSVAFMGPVKMRRINFNGYVTKRKLKRRKGKMKKYSAHKGCVAGTNPSIKKAKRLTMDAFLARFHTLMSTNVNNTSTKDVVASIV